MKDYDKLSRIKDHRLRNQMLIELDQKENQAWADKISELYPDASINKTMRIVTLTDNNHNLTIKPHPTMHDSLDVTYSFKDVINTRKTAITDTTVIAKNRLTDTNYIKELFENLKA